MRPKSERTFVIIHPDINDAGQALIQATSRAQARYRAFIAWKDAGQGDCLLAFDKVVTIKVEARDPQRRTGPDHPKWTGAKRTERIMAYYGKGYTLQEIGECVGVSKPAIHQWLRRRGLPTSMEDRNRNR